MTSEDYNMDEELDILGKWLKIESIKPTPIGLTIFVKAKKI